MNWQRRIVQDLLARLTKMLPDVSYEPGAEFSWSPKHNRVTYRPGDDGTWALLHETAHAMLGHQSYEYDVDLLLLEVEAWQKAQELAKEFGLEIDTEHIQDCLDTYRDWLHQRSACPRCSTVSLQASPQEYRCHNCEATWHVSSSRFCRPYRLSSAPNKKSSEVILQTTFR